MAAILKCYTDEHCNHELYMESSTYLLEPCPENGYNGDSGCVYNFIFYVKNVGDATAKGILLHEVGDHSDLFKMSTATTHYGEKYASLPNLKPGELTYVIVNSIIPKNTAATDGSISYVLYYYTPPVGLEDSLLTHATPLKLKKQYSRGPIEEDGVYTRTHLYGYGILNFPLYGQEGLIRKRTIIDGVLPIAGIESVPLHADYRVVNHYNGTEPTIEDIQSYYTYRYMMLGCFDGPALPLLFNETNDQELA